MRLVDIRIDGFGRLTDRRFTFGDGITVIFGLNEQGKSTLYTCIKSVLYGIRRARGRASASDTWTRFKPWDGSPYRASLRVEHQGVIYRIERDFDSNPTGVTITDDASGAAMQDAELLLSDILSGMSETAFEHTVAIGQLSAGSFVPGNAGNTQDGEDSAQAAVEEFKRYIGALSSTGDRSLSADRAIEHLNRQRRELEESLTPEAAKAYVTNISEIRSLERTLEEPRYADHISEIERSIEDNHSTFGDIPFDGREDLEFYRTSLGTVYDRLRASRAALADGKLAGGRKRAIVLCVLGVIALAAGAFLLSGASGSDTQLNIFGIGPTAVFYSTPSGIMGYIPQIVTAMGALLLAAGVIALLMNGKARKAVRAQVQADSDVVLQYTRRLGAASTDEASYADICRRLDGFAQALKLREDITTERRSQEELAELTQRLRTLKEENASLHTQIVMNDAINEEISAVDMAIETMEQLTERMQQSFAVFLNRDASDYIAGLTGGAYDSMYIDEDMNILMNAGGRMVPIEQLSTGARDQVYLAIRLAMARVIESGDDRLPLIFDDSFVYYDDDRLRAALGWMTREYKGQLIMFTCHGRETRILTELGAEFTGEEL